MRFPIYERRRYRLSLANLWDRLHDRHGPRYVTDWEGAPDCLRSLRHSRMLCMIYLLCFTCYSQRYQSVERLPTCCNASDEAYCFILKDWITQGPIGYGWSSRAERYDEIATRETCSNGPGADLL